MGSPSCNTYLDPLQVLDGHDWTMRDFDYSQLASLAYQSSTSTPAQPSRVSADPLRYTHPIRSPIAFAAPSFAISSASAGTCSDLCCFNQNAIQQALMDNERAITASASGYVGPRHDIACTNFPASASSVPMIPHGKATSDSDTKGKRPSGRTQGRRQKQENPKRSFQCYWKDCTYRDPFSGKPALLRHIDTQHIAPRSFDCPSCDMSFNRKDNMIEHRGRVHWERVRS